MLLSLYSESVATISPDTVFVAVEEVDAEGAVVERIVERAGVELERHFAAHLEFAGERVGHPTVDLGLGVDRPLSVCS